MAVSFATQVRVEVSEPALYAGTDEPGLLLLQRHHAPEH